MFERSEDSSEARIIDSGITYSRRCFDRIIDSGITHSKRVVELSRVDITESRTGGNVSSLLKLFAALIDVCI